MWNVLCNMTDYKMPVSANWAVESLISGSNSCGYLILSNIWTYHMLLIVLLLHGCFTWCCGWRKFVLPVCEKEADDKFIEHYTICFLFFVVLPWKCTYSHRWVLKQSIGILRNLFVKFAKIHLSLLLIARGTDMSFEKNVPLRSRKHCGDEQYIHRYFMSWLLPNMTTCTLENLIIGLHQYVFYF